MRHLNLQNYLIQFLRALYFKTFFEIMDDHGLQEVQGLVWEVLMTLPTQHNDEQAVTANRTQWRSVLVSEEQKIWRSLYLLQIVESELERPEWRSEFLSACRNIKELSIKDES